MGQGIACFVQASMISRISLLPVLASHLGVYARPARRPCRESIWLENCNRDSMTLLFRNRINRLHLSRKDQYNARLKCHDELRHKY